MDLLARTRALLACVLILSAWPAIVNARPCRDAATAPVRYITLTGHPFAAIPSRDGCWVFVSLTGPAPAVAVLHRSHGTLSPVRVVPTRTRPLGMELTGDGASLVVAQESGVAIFAVRTLRSRHGDPVVRYVDYGEGAATISGDTRRFVASQLGAKAAAALHTPGSVYVAITRDDRYAFVSDEWLQTITVIDLKQALYSSLSPLVGRIPAGVAPVGLALSPDGRYLYATTEAAADREHWPAECDPEGTEASSRNPAGAILVVDVAAATRDPERAVISRVPAGCTPVRVVLSPAGDRAYVTARQSNAVLVFDTRRLVADPNEALVATVPVGRAPVGVAVLNGGRGLAVTNSNRFGGSATEGETLTVIDTARVADGAAAMTGTVPTQGFPRELRVTGDGRTLLVTNFASQTLELVDISRMTPPIASRR